MSAITVFVLLLAIPPKMAQSVSDNGWRPISSEKVFSSRNFIKTRENGNSGEARNLGEFTDSTFGANIKLTDGREIHSQDFLPAAPGDRGDSMQPTYSGDTADKFENEPTSRSLAASSRRKAKKITNRELDENKIADDANEAKANDGELSNFVNTYQITEDTENITGEESNVIVNDKYNYNSKIEESNPTADFLKILSSYNIRSADKLPNYSLSLRQNSRQSPEKDYIYMHVPIRIPLRYNSPDHLPVDPLMAVLLSNYGHYLPGYFGVHGNFQNLYGYTAANNIHNNKPFGSYKIFSDSNAFH